MSDIATTRIMRMHVTGNGAVALTTRRSGRRQVWQVAVWGKDGHLVPDWDADAATGNVAVATKRYGMIVQAFA